jgi:regulator of PEP synthase PpsR (kinase-PPPase family)
VDSRASQRYQKDLSNMKSKIITVADLVEFLKMLPPDTKIRVKQEINRNYSTYTEYVEAVQYDVDYKNGIEYNEVTKTVDFGIG